MGLILVTGAKGMLGANFVSSLRKLGYEVEPHDRNLCDLLDRQLTNDYVKKVRPEAIIHCAALVGGIKANIEGGTAFYKVNKSLDANLLHAASVQKVPKLIYMGSSCMYPANRSEPLKIADLGSGPLEPTNRNYAMAKIEGTALVQKIAQTQGLSWRTLISSNLYGPFDKFGSDSSHLIAGIISKVNDANSAGLDSIEMWGDGMVRREFTFAPEFTAWVATLIDGLEDLPLVMNVGYGEDFTVREFYDMVISEMGGDIKVIANTDLPSGNRRKLMDSSIAKSIGWSPKISPQKGIRATLEWLAGNKEAS